MNIYIKGAGKALKNILLVDIVFFSFLAIIVFGLVNKNLILWIQIYSFAIFLLLLLPMLYTDFHRLAIKEKRPQYNINPFPFNGFIYGIISIIPFVIIVLLNFYVEFSNELYGLVIHYTLNVMVGPVYWVVKIGNESLISYISALLVIVLVIGAAYLAGNKDFYLKKKNIPISKQKNK